ncbi:GlxA family transcriptional regulator [Kutzneria kofuensis]|uniref:Transcriptional regulator GlxA family with amidase domain n=1 Tax=Kutzneria kofuensis TaxID=103725 RepID=A0A7W9KSM6_9PSEU|nr:helix-turn-helix domain-containing protein [Kutzneria kofuensis]MBB5897897.1 transcriptional regulator GlxA family with amidase domain [Kutzneria kofuensis]
MHRVAFVVVPPVYSFDLAIAQMVLDAARPDGRAGYEVITCAARPGRVEALGGPDVVVEHDLAAAGNADSVIVIGGGGRADVDPGVLTVVREAEASGARVAGICTGAFVLAQAGVLDGRRATTHWGLTDELARRHPAVTVVPDVLYVADGPVLTCAGAGACVELCLHLVRADYGAAVAGACARLAVAAPPRPGGQAQVVQTPLPSATDTSLAVTREWALRRLDRPISLNDLAAHAGVSVRTLTRRFHAETGLSPLQWLLHRRLDRARQLLETTTLPMDKVAWHSGMGTADSLRQHMVRRVGVTPTAYRTSFSRGQIAR